MPFCIKKFSSALCLVRSTYQSPADLPPECFMLTDNSQDVEDVIYKLSKIFEEEFHSVLDNIINNEKIENCNALMKNYLSRYVQMSMKPSYFHFMLLCSLIHTMVIDAYADLECFTYAKVISLCLMAVYNRCYKELFEKSKESESLGSYCKRINVPLLSEDGSSLLPLEFKQQIKYLLASLKDIDYSNFTLTDLEEKMLKDTLDLVRPDRIPANPEVPSNMPPYFTFSSADEANLDDKRNSLHLDEHSSNVNRICEKLCGGKCSIFLVLHQKDVLELSESFRNN